MRLTEFGALCEGGPEYNGFYGFGIVDALSAATAEPDEDLTQSTLGINLQIIYTMPVADRFDLAIAIGPSVIRTKLEVATLAVTPNSQTVTVNVTDTP